MCCDSISLNLQMWAVLFVVSAVLLPLVSSQLRDTPTVWAVQDYPDPAWAPEKCNRVNKSAVCDPNGLITRKEANDIDRLIAGVARDTRCTCYECPLNKRGYVIRVAIMTQMELENKREESLKNTLKNAREYAYLLSKQWKMTSSCEETILVLYSRNDNTIFTLTGKDARKRLSDERIVEIAMDLRTYFEESGSVGEGIKEMIKRYRAVFLGTYTRPRQTSSHREANRNRPGGYASTTYVSPMLILLASSLLVFT